MFRTRRRFVALGIVLVAGLSAGAGRAGADADASLRVEVSGALQAPFEAVRETLLDLEAFGGWFPGLTEWGVLSRQPGIARVHGRQQLPWPVSDRDYVVRYRWWEEPEGAFVLEAVALSDTGPDPAPGVVRAEEFRTEWRVERAEQATHVRYLYEGREQPVLARWAAKLGWRGPTGRVIEALAQELRLRSRDAALD